MDLSFGKIYKILGNCIGEQTRGIKGGGYEPFDTNIIKWYQTTRDKLKKENGNYVPSIVFQHIPMCEYYKILKRVKSTANIKFAVFSFIARDRQAYSLHIMNRKMFDRARFEYAPQQDIQSPDYP